MKNYTNTSLVAVASIVIVLSIFAITNANNNNNNNNAFAQPQQQKQNGGGFDKELNILKQALTALNNQDKSAKKSLFDVEGIIEDKMKDNPGITNAEKRVEAAIKMVGEGNFQAAIDHTNEAIKSLSQLK
jgi:predicted RND superfamily exporter protein